MVGNKDFSQYLAEARAKQGVVKSAGPRAAIQSNAKKKDSQDPLSWVVDILSRPMRMVQNVPNQILNEELKRKVAEQTGQEFNVAGAIGNVLTAPLRGFFSTNPEDQPTGSELIEKTSDVINYGEPGYKDVQDNVNPWAKGIGGLALDIGLDPLTWIPGAQYAKAGQVLGKTAKGVVAGADALIAGSNFGKAIGAEARVLSRAAKAEREGKLANQELINDLAVQKATLPGTAFASKAPSGYFSAEAKASRLASPLLKESYTAPTIARRAEVPLGPVSKEQIKAAGYKKNKQAIDALVPSPAALPEEVVPSASLLDTLGAPTGSTVKEQYAAAGATQNILDQLGLIKPAKAAPVEVKPFVDTFSPEIAKLEKKLIDQEAKLRITTSDTAAKRLTSNIKSTQNEINMLRAKKTEAMVPRDTSVAKSFSASETLKNLLADPVSEVALKETLGEPLVAKLAGIKDAKKLERATEHLARVVRGEPVVGSNAQRDLVQELHKQYDIKVPGTNVPAIQGTSNIGTEFVAEAKVADATGADLKDLPWLGGYTQQQIDDVIEELPEFIKSEYFLKLEGYPFTTGGGALSTSEIMGEGIHILPWEFNQMKQYTLLESMVAKERAIIKAHNYDAEVTGMGSLKIAAGNRAAILLNEAIKKSELSLKWLDTKGISAWMGKNKDRIRLYGHQLLRELNNVDKSALAMTYLNEATSVPLTNIMDAVVAMYRNPAITDDEILSLLKKPIDGAKNFLNKKSPARYGHIPDPGGKARPKNLLTEANKDSKGYIKGWYVLRTQDEVASKAIAMIRNSAPAIKETVLHNEEMAAARLIAEQKDFSPEIASNILRELDNPETFGQSIRDIADIPTFLGNEGKANFVKPQTQATIAKPAVDYWPNDALHDAQFMVKQVKAYEKDEKLLRETLTKLNIDNAGYNFDNASDIVKIRGNIYDGVSVDGRVINEAMYNDAVMEQSFNDLIMAAHLAKPKQLLVYRAGKENVIHPYDATKNAMSHALGSYQNALAKVANANRGLIPGTDTTILAQAFRDIATGSRSSAQVTAARKELEPFVWTVFGNPKDKNSVGIWQRAGADLNDMQVYMKKAKIQYEVDLTNAETKFAKGGYDSIVAAGMDDWKQWAATVDDPARFLMDMHFAGFMLHADKTAASLFVAKTGMTTTKPTVGFTKIPDNINLFEHPLIGHMPKGTYIKDEIIQEVNELEKMIMADFSPKSAAGQFINNTYLPILAAWKKGVTIYRPGHHIRNMISDASIQYVQEGVRYYANASSAAIRTLASHRGYKDIDWGQMISEIGQLSMPTTGTRLFTFGKQEITTDALYEAAMKNGLFSDYTRVEDLYDATAKTKFSDAIDKISLKDTKVEKIAGSTSEALAHYARLSHFTQILMKQGRKGKNWEKAVEEAAKKVRRSHPDGMTLTPFERAYLKPFIPFYSWFRQVAPVILEGIVMNPGRFMVYPKASYNAAVALGVDPQSLQDPFPEDVMLPSFITNKLTGPVANIDGNYFTASPGFAYADVLNQFVSDPKQGMLSMLTPFIKTPGELITGTKWDTGVTIKDYSDYIDSQIPTINYISNISGTSFTGSIAGILSGQGIDPQYAVDKGNKTVMDQGISAYNWLTGLGIQNVSKQNYIDLAEIEARNAASQAAKEAAGTARNPF